MRMYQPKKCKEFDDMMKDMFAVHIQKMGTQNMITRTKKQQIAEIGT